MKTEYPMIIRLYATQNTDTKYNTLLGYVELSPEYSNACSKVKYVFSGLRIWKIGFFVDFGEPVSEWEFSIESVVSKETLSSKVLNNSILDFWEERSINSTDNSDVGFEEGMIFRTFFKNFWVRDNGFFFNLKFKD